MVSVDVFDDYMDRDVFSLWAEGHHVLMGKRPTKYTKPCLVELACSRADTTFWVSDYRDGSPPDFSLREMSCPACQIVHSGLLIRRLSPFGLIEHLQGNCLRGFRMYREVYSDWVSLVEQNFSKRQLPINSVDLTRFPEEPGIHETICSTIDVLSVICGMDSYSHAEDWVCLTLLLEHDVRTLLGLPVQDTRDKTLNHYNEKEVPILDDLTVEKLCRQVLMASRKAVYHAVDNLSCSVRFSNRLVWRSVSSLRTKPGYFNLLPPADWVLVPSGDPTAHGCRHIGSLPVDMLLYGRHRKGTSDSPRPLSGKWLD